MRFVLFKLQEKYISKLMAKDELIWSEDAYGAQRKISSKSREIPTPLRMSSCLGNGFLGIAQSSTVIFTGNVLSRLMIPFKA
jgi:hypothetical protein